MPCLSILSKQRVQKSKSFSILMSRKSFEPIEEQGISKQIIKVFMKLFILYLKRSQPWDPAIGYPHTVETGYYPATAQTNQQAGGPTVHDRQRAPGIGAVFGNRSLDRSAMFSTQTQRLNGYLTETGRNLSQPSLAINRLVGAATGRRLPQPPPESQPTLGLPMPNTPLPMLQKPVALSTRNRKLPQGM